ncbi:MAG TPA: DUF2730 family protein [Polyangiaceae bacterium]|nr:DUF2730 family protein [Polyangiaceae bacterium]
MTHAFQAVAATGVGINWTLAVAILSLLVSVVLTFTTINSKRSWAKSEQFNELQRAHSVLAANVTHLPTSKDVNELSGSMREVTAELRGLRDDFAKVDKRMDLYEQAMLERGT